MLERFVEVAARERPGIEFVLPWRRTEDPGVLAGTLRDGGVEDVHVTQETHHVPFLAADWSAIVLGSGLRRIAVDLDRAAPGVLSECERWARQHDVSSVAVSVNYATAVKRRRPRR